MCTACPHVNCETNVLPAAKVFSNITWSCPVGQSGGTSLVSIMDTWHTPQRVTGSPTLEGLALVMIVQSLWLQKRIIYEWGFQVVSQVSSSCDQAALSPRIHVHEVVAVCPYLCDQAIQPVV